MLKKITLKTTTTTTKIKQNKKPNLKRKRNEPILTAPAPKTSFHPKE